jgi:hypothetical protein
MTQTSFDPSRLADFLAHRAQFPTHGVAKIAEGLGISESSVRRMMQAQARGRLGGIPAVVTVAPAASSSPVPAVGARQTAEACELVTENPCTLEDLLTACKVDRTEWQVARHVINKWEVGAKQENGTVLRTPLFQIKAWLERSAVLDISKALREVIHEIRVSPPVSAQAWLTVPPPTAVDDPHLLEVSMPDIHIGKLTWAPEVGESYDTALAPTIALAAAHNLWAKASVFPIRRILIPLGNDLYNVNNAAGTTAGGTPQDEDGRWKKTFKVGIKLAVDLIEFFRGKTPEGVDVMIVPGNHDPERVYYLGCVLEGIYSKSPDVRINNGEKARKYFRFGQTLLGFTHGQGEKHDKLPLIMAGEAAQDWAQTTHHEWHLGHLHHKKETRYHAGQEFGPVRVRILPSLCPADEWHFNSGYVGSKRAAEAYLWSFKHGYTGHLSYSPN